MGVTDRHDMTLAVKLALNRNTINQSITWNEVNLQTPTVQTRHAVLATHAKPDRHFLAGILNPFFSKYPSSLSPQQDLQHRVWKRTYDFRMPSYPLIWNSKPVFLHVCSTSIF